MILGRYRTGLCAKCQRKVAHTIKAARQMGLVPTVSDYEVRDTGPGGLYAWAGKGGRGKKAENKSRDRKGGDGAYYFCFAVRTLTTKRWDGDVFSLRTTL